LAQDGRNLSPNSLNNFAQSCASHGCRV
jgi:hypothetical protein